MCKKLVHNFVEALLVQLIVAVVALTFGWYTISILQVGIIVLVVATGFAVIKTHFQCRRSCCRNSCCG